MYTLVFKVAMCTGRIFARDSVDIVPRALSKAHVSICMHVGARTPRAGYLGWKGVSVLPVRFDSQCIKFSTVELFIL